jgi:hypothetical protein
MASIPEKTTSGSFRVAHFRSFLRNRGGPRNPRVDVNNPEQSPILQKATMSVPHGGGPRVEMGSEDCETILTWVQNGDPYGTEDKNTEL